MRIDYQTLRIEGAAEHVLLVTLNRPEVANAFNTQMGRDLLEFWTGMIAEPGKTGQRGMGVRILSVAMACWKKLPLRGVVFRSPPESEDFGEDNRRSFLPSPHANAER